jgi:hypothetical protein
MMRLSDAILFCCVIIGLLMAHIILHGKVDEFDVTQFFIVAGTATILRAIRQEAEHTTELEGKA